MSLNTCSAINLQSPIHFHSSENTKWEVQKLPAQKQRLQILGKILACQYIEVEEIKNSIKLLANKVHEGGGNIQIENMLSQSEGLLDLIFFVIERIKSDISRLPNS